MSTITIKWEVFIIELLFYCSSNIVFEVKFHLCQLISIGTLQSKFILDGQFYEYLYICNSTIHYKDRCDYKEHNTLNLEYYQLYLYSVLVYIKWVQSKSSGVPSHENHKACKSINFHSTSDYYNSVQIILITI